MRTLPRRRFLTSALAATATGTVASAGSAPAILTRLGANDRINLALIGCGGRGTSVISRLGYRSDVDVSYLCDLRRERLRKSALKLGEVGQKPKLVSSMREVLDDPEVDAVVVATPDHWHTPASILACQAGKDVYVEKPFCHNIWEGQQLIKAARKYDCIVQVGTQNRSAPYNLEAAEYLKSGKLGDIHLVKVFNLKPGEPFFLDRSAKAPAGFDWEAWLGPAPPRPYAEGIYQGGWHQFWDYSGGDLADDGIHQLDLAMMLMGSPAGPKAVSALGGRFHHDDDGEAPDLTIIQCEFDNFVLTVEGAYFANAMRKTPGEIRHHDKFPQWLQNATRIEFYGSKEMMLVGRHGGGWQAFSSSGHVSQQRYGRHPDPEHQQNFIDCLRSRKRPNADLMAAQSSHSVLHLGNIALRTGEKLRYDAASATLVDNPAASALMARQNTNAYSVPKQV